MNNILFKTLISLFLLLITNCKDEIVINNPTVSNELYKLEGDIFLNSFAVSNIEVFFDTLKCMSDTMGHFVFDSLKPQTSKIIVIHPHCITLDTTITIDKNLRLKIDLKYNSKLFFPLKVGNKWFYKDNYSLNNSFKVEVIKEINLNSQMYFMLEKSELNDTPLDTLYFRFEEDKIIELFIGQSLSNYYLETIFADFAATELDTFKYYIRLDDNDYYYNAFIYNDIFSTIEEFAFYYHLNGVSCSDFRTYFKIGVGLAKKIRDFGPPEFLYAYYIN